VTADLVTFLRERLADDQRIANRTRQASPEWRNFDMDGELRDSANAGTVAYIPHANDRTHIARHDPARVLAEVDAKRRIIDECSEVTVRDDWQYTDAPELAELTLLMLALPYREHPDYQPGWALEA
jgi:hypothetical protein